ncbi:MAG TPA: MFS transporter [Steroidobacteraceae bacterium]|jgi:GPH family glycoside/pentoside/hexuronide:cation symporter|nr:MFS transporter [Steroidobacteraceae bacterium]
MVTVATDSAASSKAADLRRGKLSLTFKAIYGSGQLVDGVTQIVLSTFLFFYVTAVCGLSGALTGASLSIALVVDAIADPVVGLVSDNSWTRIGRRHPFLIVAVIPTALALGLLFSIPAGLSQSALFAYVTAVSIALRVSHSAFNLPFVALGAELSDDYSERTSIVSSRFIFNVIATFSCLALGFLVFLKGADGLLNRPAYSPFGWASAGLVLAGGLTCALGTLSALGRLHPAEHAEGTVAARFARDLRELFSNKSFLVLFFSALVLFLGIGIFTTLTLHANKFFWRLPERMIQAVSILPTLGFGIGTLLNAMTAKRIERLTAVFIGLTVLSLTQGLWPLLRVLNVLPGNGTAVYTILVLNAIAAGAATGFFGVAQHSMIADASDEHEYLFGTRREGLLYASLNFSAKAAVALGALIAGVALDLIGFPSGIAAHPELQFNIANGTLQKLGVIYGPGAAVVTALSGVIFTRYHLKRRPHAIILEALAQRRQSGA